MYRDKWNANYCPYLNLQNLQGLFSVTITMYTHTGVHCTKLLMDEYTEICTWSDVKLICLKGHQVVSKVALILLTSTQLYSPPL